MDLSVRIIGPEDLPGFRQYLLPTTVAAMESGTNKKIVALGAVSGGYSLGAAAVRLIGRTRAQLTDLFVDEAVRRQGVATALTEKLVEEVRERGVKHLSADYALRGEELLAMDRTLIKAGFNDPTVRAKNFRADGNLYKDDRTLGRAFTPGWDPGENVMSFSQLPPSALEELEDANDIPRILSWRTLRDRADPELSPAMVIDGRVAAYILAEEGGGGIVLLSAVSRKGAPPTAFVTLLTDLLSRGYYWMGGMYPLYFSVINERTERLARALMRGRCVEYEEHTTRMDLEEETPEPAPEAREQVISPAAEDGSPDDDIM